MGDYIKMTNIDVLVNTGWNITSRVVGTTNPDCRWEIKLFFKNG